MGKKGNTIESEAKKKHCITSGFIWTSTFPL